MDYETIKKNEMDLGLIKPNLLDVGYVLAMIGLKQIFLG